MTSIQEIPATMAPPERVALIGARGTGKTSVGLFLAQALGWKFIDADKVLEQKEGRSIRDIFSKEGEPFFRQLESAILMELCSQPLCVLATGGGVVLSQANRDLLRQSSFVVWLEADGTTLQKRLEKDPATLHQRPSLTGGHSAVSLQEIESILEARRPLYQATAHYRLATADKTPEELAAILVKLPALASLAISPESNMSAKHPSTTPITGF